MLRKSQHLGLLVMVATLLVASAAKAGVFKGHPYYDPHSSVPFSAAMSADGPGVYVMPHAANCCPGNPLEIVPPYRNYEASSHMQLHAATTLPYASARRPNCPPPTNALLRVWVDDHAMVWVNGRRTKPQMLAGVHRGSRIFTLTGLAPDEIREAIVRVEMYDGFHVVLQQEKKELVQAGQTYEIRFDDPCPLTTRLSPYGPSGRMDPGSRAEQAASNAETAKRDAETAAEDAQATEDRINQVVDAAREEFSKQVRETKKLKAAAAHSAKQAARSDSETFDFVQDHKSLVAWVKYADDGGISELRFDRLTRTDLEFKETSGSLENLTDVKIPMNYYFAIETPERTVERKFELLGQPVSFSKGSGKASFFDPDEPDKHLSSEFKKAITQNWSKRFNDTMRIKVEIKAIRPNGEEAEVAPLGKRITIEVQELQ